MEVFWFFFWIIVCYAVIVLAFLILMKISIAIENEERKRQECMMNHPAGSRARIAPSPSGQTRETFPLSSLSENYDLHTNMVFGKMVRAFDKLTDDQLRERYKGGLQLPHSSEGSSSRPYHLESD